MKSNRHLACCLGCAYLFMSASLQGRDSMPPYWLSVCCICVWGGVYVCVFVWLCPFLVFRCQDFSALSASCLLFMQRWTHAHNHAPSVELIAWQSNVEYIRRWKQFGVPEWREHHSLILLTDIDFKKVLKQVFHNLWQHCGGNCAMRVEGRQHTDNVPPAFAVALPPCPSVHQECGHHNPCTNKKPKGTIPVYLHVRSANGHCCVSGSEQAVPMQDALFLFSFKGCVTCRISPGGAFPFPLKNLSSAVLGK